MSVVVYTLPNCVQCEMTKKMLNKNNVEFDSVNLAENEDAYELVKSMGFQTAPVVFANGDSWGGFRIDKINALANQKSA